MSYVKRARLLLPFWIHRTCLQLHGANRRSNGRITLSSGAVSLINPAAIRQNNGYLRHASNVGSQPQPGPPGPLADTNSESDNSRDQQRLNGNEKGAHSWKDTAFKVFEAAATTFASISILGLAGYGYHLYYKRLVIRKMEIAFMPGDPVLELAAMESGLLAKKAGTDSGEHWIQRAEQSRIDAIVDGTEKGHYYLLIGEKGTGKSSMLLDAMQKVDGEGISMFEAHADLEIFRVRLGKALNYEFHEDYIGSFFSVKGPRDTTALLDIERAFNKLEKVALTRRRKVGRPLVLIVNATHLLRDDKDGRDLLELIQQRAEQWAAADLVTVVLNSDNYWVYERLKQLATRLEVLPVPDLPKSLALDALARYRARFFPDTRHDDGDQSYNNRSEPSQDVLEEVYRLVGGRLSFLSRVAKAKDMLAECRLICERERTWLLNQCWILGEEMDDDVMEQGKYSSTAMLLAKALVDRQQKADANPNPNPTSISSSSSSTSPLPLHNLLPEIPLHEARQIMTRADYIRAYDQLNIFTIDSRAMVRADSVPMQNAFREVCGADGFEEHLERTLRRISAIESLGRTREVVAKDLVGGESGGGGGVYRIRRVGDKGEGKGKGKEQGAGEEYTVGFEEGGGRGGQREE